MPRANNKEELTQSSGQTCAHALVCQCERTPVLDSKSAFIIFWVLLLRHREFALRSLSTETRDLCRRPVYCNILFRVRSSLGVNHARAALCSFNAAS